MDMKDWRSEGLVLVRGGGDHMDVGVSQASSRVTEEGGCEPDATVPAGRWRAARTRQQTAKRRGKVLSSATAIG